MVKLKDICALIGPILGMGEWERKWSLIREAIEGLI